LEEKTPKYIFFTQKQLACCLLFDFYPKHFYFEDWLLAMLEINACVCFLPHHFSSPPMLYVCMPCGPRIFCLSSRTPWTQCTPMMVFWVVQVSDLPQETADMTGAFCCRPLFSAPFAKITEALPGRTGLTLVPKEYPS